MFESPEVSVCIATYYHDKYIQAAVVSVLAQSIDVSIEILIGDDGRGEDTPSIVDELSKKHPGCIRYFRHLEPLGGSENYRFLVREAKGTYIAHLDGDDFWLPGKLAAQLKWMKTHPNSPACYTNAVVVDNELEVLGVFSSPIRSAFDCAFLLEKGNFLNHSSMLYRAAYKNLILETNGPLIDYSMHLMFAAHDALGFINASYTVYRLGSDHSLVRTIPDMVQKYNFDAMVLAVANEKNFDPVLRRKIFAFFLKTIMIECLLRKRFKWAIEWIEKIRTLYPRDIKYILFFGSISAFKTIFVLTMRRTAEKLLGVTSLKVFHER